MSKVKTANFCCNRLKDLQEMCYYKNGKTILLQALQSLVCKTIGNVCVVIPMESMGCLMKKTAAMFAMEILKRSAVEIGKIQCTPLMKVFFIVCWSQ